MFKLGDRIPGIESVTKDFNTELFLKVKVEARKYFFSERLNFSRNPTVTEIMEYLSYYFDEKDLPTISTVARWHTSWKRSN